MHYLVRTKLEGGRELVAQESEIVTAYDGDVEAADHAVGRLLDHLRDRQLLDQTMVIYTPTTARTSARTTTLANTLWSTKVAVRIPLVVRYPSALPRRGSALRYRPQHRHRPTALDTWAVPTGDGWLIAPTVVP